MGLALPAAGCGELYINFSPGDGWLEGSLLSLQPWRSGTVCTQACFAQLSALPLSEDEEGLDCQTEAEQVTADAFHISCLHH